MSVRSSSGLSLRADAPLLYQLLIGELELRNGEAGTAYQVLAGCGAPHRRCRPSYKRVVQIAVQARGRPGAVRAAAWTTAHPDSPDAWQSTVQLLAVLNRPADAVEPMRNLLSVGTSAERLAALAMLPQWFQRSPEPQRWPPWRRCCRPSKASSRPAALVTEARLSLSAGLFERARPLHANRAGSTRGRRRHDPGVGPVASCPLAPRPRSLQRLAAQPGRNAIAQAYARALVRMRRRRCLRSTAS